MAELSFGEKLLIARKQLDLYQYQMAERLGVHPNSIAKYERGEGKPHAAVVRMFDLLCEKDGIRFDEYESGETRKGAAMKIVLAEKVSPATAAVFAAEPGWEVVTHDQLPDGLPAALKDADALYAGGPSEGCVYVELTTSGKFEVELPSSVDARVRLPDQVAATPPALNCPPKKFPVTVAPLILPVDPLVGPPKGLS